MIDTACERVFKCNFADAKVVQNQMVWGVHKYKTKTHIWHRCELAMKNTNRQVDVFVQ